MDGGFTFKGIHSSAFNVRETPNSRTLFSPKTRNPVTIPGNYFQFIADENQYADKKESITCSYYGKEGVELQKQIRLIAGWLSGIGQLEFDYEPGYFYNAYVSSPPDLTKTNEYASFSVEFTYSPPFAYTKHLPLTVTVHNEDVIGITSEGTIEAPVRITIKNVGTSTIQNLYIDKNIF